MTALLLTLKVLAVFVLIGPLVGLVVFSTSVSVLALVHGPTEAVWLGPFFLVYGLIFAHFFGAIWAAVAGLSALAASRLTGTLSSWIGLAGGTMSWILATISGGTPFPTPQDGPMTASIDALRPAFMSIALLTHLVASYLCWLIARRFIPAPMSGNTA